MFVLIFGDDSLFATNQSVKLTPESKKIYTKNWVYSKSYPIDSQWIANQCKCLVFRLLDNFLPQNRQ